MINVSNKLGVSICGLSLVGNSFLSNYEIRYPIIENKSDALNNVNLKN